MATLNQLRRVEGLKRHIGLRCIAALGIFTDRDTTRWTEEFLSEQGYFRFADEPFLQFVGRSCGGLTPEEVEALL